MQTIARTFAISVAVAGSVMAQGPLVPTGAPAPNMKTLQELWDELQTLKATAASTNLILSNKLDNLALQGDALLTNHNVATQVVWNTFSVDSAASSSNSELVSLMPSDGLPVAIYPVSTSSTVPIAGEVRIAKFNGLSWSYSTLHNQWAGNFSKLIDNTGATVVLLSNFQGLNDPANPAANAPTIAFRMVGTTGTSATRVTNLETALASPDRLAGTIKYLPNGHLANVAAVVNADSTRQYFYQVWDNTEWSTPSQIPLAPATSLSSFAIAPSGVPALVSGVIVTGRGQQACPVTYSTFNGTTWTSTAAGTTLALSQIQKLGFGPTGNPVFVTIGQAPSTSITTPYFFEFDGTDWSNTNINSQVGGGLLGDVISQIVWGADGTPRAVFRRRLVTSHIMQYVRRVNGVWTVDFTTLQAGFRRDVTLLTGKDGRPLFIAGGVNQPVKYMFRQVLGPK